MLPNSEMPPCIVSRWSNAQAPAISRSSELGVGVCGAGLRDVRDKTVRRSR
jgi:hypothetical protein